ncbi:hypothetical protein PMAYCL1PPCAC_19171, partial [Pristionchus mayeri]
MLMTPDELGIHFSLTLIAVALSDGRFHNSIYSRIMNLRHRYLWRSFLSVQNEPLQRIFDELFPGTPSFSELVSHSAAVFTNSEPLISVAYPTLSKIIPIGGITVGKPNPLNDYWNTILSLRPKTVLVSFGSIAKSVLMKPAGKNALLEAFSSFPDTTFIWKYENTSDFFSTYQASQVPNVVLTEWVPQLDILADRRLSLFISHGGMASCHELTTFGVPTLFIPIFGDQIHNAAFLAHIGSADVFYKFDMVDSTKIRAAVEKMLSDPRFISSFFIEIRVTTVAERLRDQLADRPSTPAQQLVSHVEFAARFGPSKLLRPLSLDLSPIQFWGIDLILIAI